MLSQPSRRVTPERFIGVIWMETYTLEAVWTDFGWTVYIHTAPAPPRTEQVECPSTLKTPNNMRNQFFRRFYHDSRLICASLIAPETPTNVPHRSPNSICSRSRMGKRLADIFNGFLQILSKSESFRMYFNNDQIPEIELR